MESSVEVSGEPGAGSRDTVSKAWGIVAGLCDTFIATIAVR